MCEDLGAEPLFVINCGMSHHGVVPLNQMGPWVQDALDAIEYANGPRTSKWGRVRAQNGHPAPFNLRYMEIGNENGGPNYQPRYALFYDAIKARYPDFHLVADTPTETRPAEIVDEHYYSNPDFFLRNADRYDGYDRHGPKVYVGEYAVTQDCGQGNLRGALGEAAFMTGMERNSDLVLMASYAPLFANVHYKKWNPDLIDFDSARAYGIPSYYVQKLFSENRGDEVLPLRLVLDTNTSLPAPHGGVGLGTWETQAEFKDLKVTHGQQVLFAPDLERGTSGWRREGAGGDWAVTGGALRQTASGADRRFVTGDPAWSDYTYSLKARKLGGREGFLILFHVQDENNWVWWNLGGWGNSRHALEQSVGGSKSLLGTGAAGQIETGRWYDVRIETQGPQIRCYLDGRLVEQAAYALPRPVHAVATRVATSGEVILKVVNTASTALETRVQLDGVARVQPRATATVLTSASPTDENSLEQPTKVAPRQEVIANAATSFSHTFAPYSLTVVRLAPEK